MNDLIVVKSKKINKKLVGYVLFCIVIAALYFFDFKNSQSFNNYKVCAIVAYCAFCIVLFVSFYFLNKFIALKKVPIHKKFFILALCFGALHLFLIPFLMGADEQGHFCRAYEISQGDLFTPIDDSGNVGNVLPSSLKELKNVCNDDFKYTNLKNGLSIPLNQNETENYKNYYISISLYSPVQYLPQAIGILFARILNFNVYWIGMMGRIFGFLFWLITCTYALKIMPIKKNFCMLLLLSPICIGYATTLSGDMMLNAMIILLISKICKFRYEKKILNKKDIILLGVICCIISLCKVVYFPIVFSIFFIPKECFKDRKKYYKVLAIIVLISIIISFAWFIYSNNNYLESYYNNADLQKQFILHNPFRYVTIMCKTLLNYAVVYLTYSSQVNIYPIISVLLWGILACSLLNLNDTRLEKLKRHEKMLVASIVLFTIILIFTAIYIQFTAMTVGVGNDLVEGIQMRYFLPLIIILPLIVNKKICLIKDSTLNLTFLMLQLPIFITMFITYF